MALVDDELVVVVVIVVVLVARVTAGLLVELLLDPHEARANAGMSAMSVRTLMV
jgi:hypothetical protein